MMWAFSFRIFFSSSCFGLYRGSPTSNEAHTFFTNETISDEITCLHGSVAVEKTTLKTLSYSMEAPLLQAQGYDGKQPHLIRHGSKIWGGPELRHALAGCKASRSCERLPVAVSEPGQSHHS